jgi:uncharacterized protein (DUF58 family)
VTRAATPKLATYVALASAALLAGLVLGRVELVVLAAPVITALAAGLALTREPHMGVDLALSSDRCLEGELLQLEVTLTSDAHVEVDVVVALPRGLTADRRHFVAMPVRPQASTTLTVTLRARRWGVYPVGRVALRVEGPGGLVRYESAHDLSRPVRVFPAMERLRKHIEPPQTQVFVGNYVSRASGDGLEFAAVRQFAPGDARRRVNWRVTSRRGELHVNDFHPERNADIVLFLDTFSDVGVPERTSLDLGVRGAATLARHYLLRKDRVGLVAFGGLLGWLTVNSGQAHLYRIVDYLMGVEATLSYARKDIEYLPRRSLPQLALVIAFSPLVDERALKAFIDLHARGFGLVIVDTLVEDAVAPGPSAEDVVAFRAWRLMRAARRFDLATLGVPVIAWPGDEGLEAVAARLPPLRRMPRARRA